MNTENFRFFWSDYDCQEIDTEPVLWNSVPGDGPEDAMHATSASGKKKRGLDEAVVAASGKKKKVKASKAVSKLMNKWTAVREQEKAVEKGKEEEEFDPAALEKKKIQRIQKWKIEQLQSAQSQANANFQVCALGDVRHIQVGLVCLMLQCQLSWQLYSFEQAAEIVVVVCVCELYVPMPM